MDKEATESNDYQCNGGDDEIEHIVKRLALHFQSVYHLAEVKRAAVAMVSF